MLLNGAIFHQPIDKLLHTNVSWAMRNVIALNKIYYSGIVENGIAPYAFAHDIIAYITH